MKTHLLTLIFFGFFSCLFGQETITKTLLHDGQNREYIVYIPASYDGSINVPLVLNFHGYTQTAEYQMNYGDFRPLAETENFIVVHPQGLLDNSGATHWNCFGLTNVDDLGFVSALIDQLALDYQIDPNRVYATGYSNGGFMSHYLACKLSNKIAAIASVAGGVPPNIDSCTIEEPLATLMINGTNDPLTDYTTYAESGLTNWSNLNNCMSYSEEPLPDLDPNDGSTVIRMTYGDCDESVLSKLLKIDGGGHDWPSITNSGNNDIVASDEIWTFLIQFQKLGTTLPIELSAFNGQANQNNIELIWKTESEIDFESFQVEHSTDATNWQTLATIPGRGFEEGEMNYSFEHLKPSIGQNYYRLKQVDISQEFEYSSIIQVDYFNDDIIWVDHNIVTSGETIVIKNHGTTLFQAVLKNTQGQFIQKTNSISPGDEMSLNTSGLKPGIYYLVFTSKNQVITKVLQVY